MGTIFIQTYGVTLNGFLVGETAGGIAITWGQWGFGAAAYSTDFLGGGYPVSYSAAVGIAYSPATADVAGGPSFTIGGSATVSEIPGGPGISLGASKSTSFNPDGSLNTSATTWGIYPGIGVGAPAEIHAGISNTTYGAPYMGSPEAFGLKWGPTTAETWAPWASTAEYNKIYGLPNTAQTANDPFRSGSTIPIPYLSQYMQLPIANGLTSNNPPPALADTFRSASGIDAVIIGLSSFIDREIEFEIGRLNPLDVLNNVVGLASYRIKHGKVIKEGGTFGSSEAERISIARHLSVPWRPGNLARRGGIDGVHNVCQT